MKQLLVRLDDQLHARLKDRAARDGRSANAMVTELLEGALGEADDRVAYRRRLARAGMLVKPPVVQLARSRAEVIARTRGSGRAASDALDTERAAR